MNSPSSSDNGAEPTMTADTRPPKRLSRISALTSAATASALAVSPLARRRSTSVWNRWNTMSHTRGTKARAVGRISSMSSKSVDMSLDAAKYPVPPVDRVEVRVPRPMM
ncbi:Uncharacterised protein [Mycobacteroides abscessus subsp. massiliense]|nr:Uncharacterised protein [Mycobacteroides abscessus subsp. massiliense]SKH26966.1 Uncharacterised protein [Mycobacteroides abscessus subsp. massiliense]SKI51154.1 Uncharacterised protein [Mycobacteroides abscessus subsp. massiliense]SKO65082.1 Uncharacterised protein [Mycobacteroides abscessus subsp. massiliense]SKR38416.1 Uncharacterised protein [Mycobacteroides abscessus subsp. massiliense]